MVWRYFNVSEHFGKMPGRARTEALVKRAGVGRGNPEFQIAIVLPAEMRAYWD